MENLKVKISSEAESKEAQELFFELGYNWFKKGYVEVKTPETIMAFENGALTTGIRGSINHKEITLLELRDLVVLKRNDVGDATHKDPNEKESLYFRLFGDWWNLFTGGKWQQFCHAESPRCAKLKPIEKKEMKEYLRKNSNGTYSYIGTVRPEHVSDFMIEIPEGATKLVSHNYVHLPIMFVKPCANGYSYCYPSDIWSDTILSDIKGRDIFWSRHTHPEELPFIDDEPKRKRISVTISKPSLNDQYAEIEKVRQSHRTASEIADSALKHIRERAETYDQPTGERSAAKTAKAFNAITGKDITESEVWLLLQLLKDVRQWSREDYHQDSAEDCIAYAALKAESLEGGE